MNFTRVHHHQMKTCEFLTNLSRCDPKKNDNKKTYHIRRFFVFGMVSLLLPLAGFVSVALNASPCFLE